MIFGISFGVDDVDPITYISLFISSACVSLSQENTIPSGENTELKKSQGPEEETGAGSNAF